MYSMFIYFQCFFFSGDSHFLGRSLENRDFSCESDMTQAICAIGCDADFKNDIIHAEHFRKWHADGRFTW